MNSVFGSTRVKESPQYDRFVIGYYKPTTLFPRGKKFYSRSFSRIKGGHCFASIYKNEAQIYLGRAAAVEAANALKVARELPVFIERAAVTQPEKPAVRIKPDIIE